MMNFHGLFRNALRCRILITEKPMEYHLDEWYVMTLYVAGGWPIISSNIFKFDHNYSVKGGLKVFDCIVQSAEYWHPYGTKKEGKKKKIYCSYLAR